jgi:hypothetical protein
VFHCAIKKRIEGGRVKETGKTGRRRRPVEMQRRRREVEGGGLDARTRPVSERRRGKGEMGHPGGTGRREDWAARVRRKGRMKMGRRRVWARRKRSGPRLKWEKEKGLGLEFSLFIFSNLFKLKHFSKSKHYKPFSKHFKDF